LQRVATIACAALAACTGTVDTTIDRTFDPCTLAITASGTDVQMAGIVDGLAHWGLDNEGTVPIELRFEDAAPAFHGLYDDERGVIFINRGITHPEPLAIVIAHELGHAFGLPHVEKSRRSLMNPGNLTIAPTDEDRAAVEALWGTCPTSSF
jgi:hypothetical protein